MPRPIWNGAISFGLVNIPVKLYSAVAKKAIHFNQLHKADGSRIRLKRVSATSGEDVPNDELVKGFEISSDRYVIITPQELAAVLPKMSRSIEIEDFVNLAEIDPIYFEKSYYLVPDKGAAKAYALLWSAMNAADKTALARFVMRDKEYLAAIRPSQNVLVLSTMFFADEVIAPSILEGLPIMEQSPTEREFAMAEQLIATLSTEFAPDKYHDDYREQVLAMIERKAEGEQITVQAEAPQGGKVIDLMQALEASLAAIKKKTSLADAKKMTPLPKDRRPKTHAH